MVSPPPCPVDLHAVAGLCWRLRLPHRAVRGAQVVACLRSSQCLAQLGGAGLPMLHRPSSLSPVVAVRHTLNGRPAVWCFNARQVIGFGGTGVEVDDFEANSEKAAEFFMLAAAQARVCARAAMRLLLCGRFRLATSRRCCQERREGSPMAGSGTCVSPGLYVTCCPLSPACPVLAARSQSICASLFCLASRLRAWP